MNRLQKTIIKFGSEPERKNAKYPNFVFISFIAMSKPCDLEVSVAFEKSEKEKAI